MSYSSKFGVTVCLCVAWAAQAQTITGIITTIAGNGGQGFAGDNGPALSANMYQPFSAVSVGGNLYIADQVNSAIRMVNSSGTITTIAGAQGNGFSGDDGKATSAQLSDPTGVLVDSSGNVYIADTGNDCIRKISTSGIITTFAGTGANAGYAGDGSPPSSALLTKPSAMAFDSAGNLYIADTGNNVIRKVASPTSASPTISTYAGSFAKGGSYLGDGGSALNAALNAPVGIAFDSSGNLYIADSGNNVIRKVGPGPGYVISTVAGNGSFGFSGDGTRPPTLSQLGHAGGVAVDSTGNIYISDTFNSRIRVVPPNGTSINTVIGTGQAAYFGDGGSGLQAAVNYPECLTFDSSGNLIIADTRNNVIRKFVPGSSGGSKPAISAGGIISASQFGAYSSIAPGTWIEIYGTNLANTTTNWSSAFANGNINAPATVGGTTVTIGNLNAYIDYVSPTQVNAQVPFAVNPGTQQIVVSTAAGQSANYAINVTSTQAGLFAPANFAVGGKQYVGAFHQNGTVVMPTGAVSGVTSSPASVGEIITMYGVGFGPVNIQLTDGQLVQGLNSITTPLTMFFGSTPATFNYDGLAPGYLGLYQFNVIVPNVASGSAIPLAFILGSTNSAQTLYTAVQ